MGNEVYFPRMATIKEASTVSGLAVYRIRQLVAARQVKFIHAGRRILVNLDSLARYLEQGDQQESATSGGIRRIPE